MIETPEHRACRSNTADEVLASRMSERRRTQPQWPASAEVYASAGQPEPVWAQAPGLCDRVCPHHNRRCSQPHTDNIGHACYWCTTETEAF